MNVAALHSVVCGKNVLVFKRHHCFVSPRKKDVVAEKVNAGKKKCSYKVWSQKARITHSRIKHSNYLSIFGHAGRKENYRNQRKNRPQQTIDPGNKIEIVIKEYFLFGDRLINELFNVLTEIDRNCNNGKKQGRKKKCAQVFADYISV